VEVDDELGDIAVEDERNSDGNSVIIFRLLDNKELSADGKFETKAITISSAEKPESGDRYGAKISFANVPLEDKIKPALVVDIDDHYAITPIENVITLEFDEALKYADGVSSTIAATMAAYDFVIEANGEVLDANYDYTVAIDDANKKKVNITLIGDYKTYDGPVYISTASTVKTIVDASDNVLADIDDEEIEVETTPTVEITVAGAVYSNVVLTFNEEMDVATLEDFENFVFAEFDEENLWTSFTVNDDGDVLTIGLAKLQGGALVAIEAKDGAEIWITDGVTDYYGTEFAPAFYVYSEDTKQWTEEGAIEWDEDGKTWKKAEKAD
jgi:hypothetical protein